MRSTMYLFDIELTDDDRAEGEVEVYAPAGGEDGVVQLEGWSLLRVHFAEGGELNALDRSDRDAVDRWSAAHGAELTQAIHDYVDSLDPFEVAAKWEREEDERILGEEADWAWAERGHRWSGGF